MIILGLLLILGAAGLSIAAIMANDGIFTASAGTVEMFGRQMDMTIGQVFLTGATAGALILLGIIMVISGMGHKARRRASTQRELRGQRQEMQDLQRKHEATSSELADQRAADQESAAREEVQARR